MSLHGFSSSPTDGETVEVVVKWFNLSKGFGFVAPMDRTADAFLHQSVLNDANMQQVAEGTKMLAIVGQGQKGRQVIRILQVLGVADPASFAPPRASSHGHAGPTAEVSGTVKWFKPEKGFGFVAPDDGGKDVFVHRSVLLRAGVQHLDSGQRVRMEVQSSAKGREASSLVVAD